jgi:hypothetical protein
VPISRARIRGGASSARTRSRPRWCSARRRTTRSSSRSTVRRPSPRQLLQHATRRFPPTRAPTTLTWPRQSPLCRAPRRRARAPTAPGRTTRESTGTASGEPQLPSPTHTLRANPALPDRRIAEPRENASHAASSSAVSSNAMSDGERVPGCDLDAPASSCTPNGASPGPREANAGSEDGRARIYGRMGTPPDRCRTRTPGSRSAAAARAESVPVLDRQVRDAARRVDDRRAVRVAPSSAPVGHASTHALQVPQWSSLERRVGSSSSSSSSEPRKKYEPRRGCDEHGVAAEPAEPGALRQLALEHRSGVDVRARGGSSRPTRARARTSSAAASS